MKTRSKLYPLLLAVSLAPSVALAVQEVFSGIPLLGTEQVPPNNSTGYGAVTAIYDQDTGILFYEFEWRLAGTNEATEAHFHLGARGESGSVVKPLGTLTGNSGKVSDFGD